MITVCNVLLVSYIVRQYISKFKYCVYKIKSGHITPDTLRHRSLPPSGCRTEITRCHLTCLRALLNKFSATNIFPHLLSRKFVCTKVFARCSLFRWSSTSPD